MLRGMAEHLTPRQVDIAALEGYSHMDGVLSHAATDPIYTEPCVLDRSASRGPTWAVFADTVGGTATIQVYIGGAWRDTGLTFPVTAGIVDTYDCERLLRASRLKFVPASSSSSEFYWEFKAQVTI
jgi:hypothetical protein